MATASTTTPTRAGQVARELWREVLQRRLREDDLFMTEAQVAERFGVSRGVAREAVSRLRALGALKSRQAKGLLVGRPDPVKLFGEALPLSVQGTQDLRSLARLRYVLEIGAVDLIVAHADDDQIEQLDAAARAFEAAQGSGDIGAINAADLAFHRGLLAMVDTPAVADMHGVLADYFSAEARALTGPLASGDTAVWQHHVIVQALRQRDAEQLRAVLRQHLRGLIGG